jgi:hypothetical protein
LVRVEDLPPYDTISLIFNATCPLEWGTVKPGLDVKGSVVIRMRHND